MKSLISKHNFLNLIGIFVLLGILIILPLVFRNPYIIHLLIMNYIGIVLGMTFTMLYGSGLISLGISAFYGVGAYSSTLLVMNTGLNFWQALPLSVLITGIIGLGIGSVIIRHPGMTFVVLTLVFNMVIVQMTGQIELLEVGAGL